MKMSKLSHIFRVKEKDMITAILSRSVRGMKNYFPKMFKTSKNVPSIVKVKQPKTEHTTSQFSIYKVNEKTSQDSWGPKPTTGNIPGLLLPNAATLWYIRKESNLYRDALLWVNIKQPFQKIVKKT